MTGHFDIVVMPADILDALAFQPRNAFRVKYQLFQFAADTVVVGLHIDDGAQFGLAQNLVILRLASANADDAIDNASNETAIVFFICLLINF